MTVTYTAQVATSSFSCFLKLLVRWKGSIYKILWKDFALFTFFYYFLAFIYRFALNPEQKKIFELISRYCEGNNNLIPLAFVLGFFIDMVIQRWWTQILKIPWPDRMAMFVTANVAGLDERGRVMRRTIMRYLCLSYVITMSSISPVVRKRFPTFQHMTDAGFMLPNEQKIMENINTPHNKYFVPLAWSTSLVQRARKEGRIKEDFAVKTLNDEINEYRGQLGALFLYDWIPIPLVYTQVVTIAVYMFFLSCLMGRQFLNDDPSMPDMFFPIFTFAQYLFYMGWLKVAESLINPFGEDDEDIDVNSLIDRNLQVSYLIVDEMHSEHPELIKDQYWDEVQFQLPYTVAAEPFRNKTPHLGSAMNIDLPMKDREFVSSMNAINEELSEDIDPLLDVEFGTNPCSRPKNLPLFRLSSVTSSIRSSRFPTKRRRFSRQSTVNESPKVQTPKHPSGPQSISSVTVEQLDIPTTPVSQQVSQQEDIFKMSDFEDETSFLSSTNTPTRKKKEMPGVSCNSTPSNLVLPPERCGIGLEDEHRKIEEGDETMDDFQRAIIDDIRSIHTRPDQTVQASLPRYIDVLRRDQNNGSGVRIGSTISVGGEISSKPDPSTTTNDIKSHTRTISNCI